MNTKITSQSYGKSDIRLTRVTRDGPRHRVVELSAQILLEGGFDAAYKQGDNRLVIPTDTMKNTVYAFARQYEIEEIEPFACRLAEHFTAAFEHVSRVTVRLWEQQWQPLSIAGDEYPAAFVGTNQERATCAVVGNRDGRQVMSGLEDLRVMRTADSGFSDFLKDKYTTLEDTEDRLLATTISAEWAYSQNDADWSACRETIRTALLRQFATHKSRSVQETLHTMAVASLDACAAIDSITLHMPNQHRLLVDLSSFGLENPNEIFQPTDAPYGMIQATITRQGKSST